MLTSKFLSKTDGVATLNFHHRQREFFGAGRKEPHPWKHGWIVKHKEEVRVDR